MTQSLEERFSAWLWQENVSHSLAHSTGLIKILRALHLMVLEARDGQLSLLAMSLVYTTLLALAPLMALSFSVLQAFGVHNQMEPLLLNLLSPLGEQGIEITQRIIEFVGNIKVGVLGAVGLAVLLYTVIALMQKIEAALNYVWQVQQSRRFVQRFSDYFSVIVIGPVLLFAAIGASASFLNEATVQSVLHTEPLQTIVTFIAGLVPKLMIILAFTFVYIFVPNTIVNFRAALVGGFAAGVMWQSVGWGFASFITTSGQYTAVYSAFAALILFMLWMYLSWMILLIGANIAFYVQFPHYLTRQRSLIELSHVQEERLGMEIMAQVVQCYYQGEPACSEESLARRFSLPLEAVKKASRALSEYGLLAQTADGGLLPASPPDSTPLVRVLEAIRESHACAGLSDDLPLNHAISPMLEAVNQAAYQTLQGKTLKDLQQAD